MFGKKWDLLAEVGYIWKNEPHKEKE